MAIMTSEAHDNAGSSKGAEEEMCITVIMMNELQF
jgi:hypothetical protein